MKPVSTSLFYDRSRTAMAALSAQADKLSTQISTTKKLAGAADDVVAYQRLRGIAGAVADDRAYAGNVALAQGILQQADSALGAVGDRLARAKEIAVQAGNPLLDVTARAALAEELDGIRADIAGQLAATDARGQPLFPAEGDGAAIPVGEGRTVVTNAGIAALTTNGDATLADTLAAMATALRDGTAVDSAALNAITDQVTNVRTTLGARAARVDVEAAQMKIVATDRETVRSGLEDTDVAAAITELQKTMTVLQATQASFSKLSGLSLFDYLR